MMLRSEIEADILYHELSSGKFFITPVPDGVVWYDSKQEAFDAVGARTIEKVWKLEDY